MRTYQGAVAATLFSFATIAFAQNYHVVDHWKIGGQGGWDYLLSDDAAFMTGTMVNVDGGWLVT